jgi:hypothetical protein
MVYGSAGRNSNSGELSDAKESIGMRTSSTDDFLSSRQQKGGGGADRWWRSS